MEEGTVLLNLLYASSLTLRELLQKLNVSIKVCGKISFTFKGTDLDNHKRNWQLLSLITMSSKCFLAPPCFARRAQQIRPLIHVNFLFPSIPLSIKRRQLAPGQLPTRVSSSSEPRVLAHAPAACLPMSSPAT